MAKEYGFGQIRRIRGHRWSLFGSSRFLACCYRRLSLGLNIVRLLDQLLASMAEQCRKADDAPIQGHTLGPRWGAYKQERDGIR